MIEVAEEIEKVPHTPSQKIRNFLEKIPHIIPIVVVLMLVIFAQTVFQQRQEIRSGAAGVECGYIFNNLSACSTYCAKQVEKTCQQNSTKQWGCCNRILTPTPSPTLCRRPEGQIPCPKGYWCRKTCNPAPGAVGCAQYDVCELGPSPTPTPSPIPTQVKCGSFNNYSCPAGYVCPKETCKVVNGATICMTGGFCKPDLIPTPIPTCGPCLGYSPAVDFCKNGTIVSQGVDNCKCPLPPICTTVTPTSSSGKFINCASDVKQCPNGSYVRRTPPSCAFDSCSVTVVKPIVKDLKASVSGNSVTLSAIPLNSLNKAMFYAFFVEKAGETNAVNILKGVWISAKSGDNVSYVFNGLVKGKYNWTVRVVLDGVEMNGVSFPPYSDKVFAPYQSFEIL
jgi:hypothetical protein